MKKVFIITKCNYPYGDANGNRFYNFAKMCKESGYEPHILCLGKNHIEVNEHEFEAKSFYKNTNNKMVKVGVYLSFISNCLKEIDKYNDVEAVISHTMMFMLDFKRLQHYCDRKKIKLIFSAVEWYSANQFKSKLSWEYLNCDLYHKRVIPKTNTSVVSISRYLQRYYKSVNTKCVYIPSIMDTRETDAKKTLLKKQISIIYAGSPVKKDYIGNVVCSCALLSKEELKFLKIKLLGIDENQLTTICEVPRHIIEYLGSSLVLFGRVPRTRVLEEYVTSDFSILIRSSKLRYARAGFPTKFAESMATGTPVICNLTSDLKNYCIDGENSIVVNSENNEDIVKAIRKAINTTYEKRLEMCENARNTACDRFDYRVYSNKLKKLFV